MTKDQAIKLIAAYCSELERVGSDDKNLKEIINRWKGGSESKVMRWLGYLQGALHYSSVYSLEELKAHSRLVSLDPPIGVLATVLMSRESAGDEMGPGMIHDVIDNEKSPSDVFDMLISISESIENEKLSQQSVDSDKP